MKYRKFSADRIFDGQSFVEEGRVLITDFGGTVVELVNKEEAGDDVEMLEGTLVPGFINCHCHLELSHMKGIIPPRTGLIDFLIAVVTRRSSASEAEILEKIAAAEQEMFRNGIMGVADTCNTLHTLQIKQQSRLRWHNLIEVLNFYDDTLPEKLKHYQSIRAAYKKSEAGAVLTPHAPYTASPGTYKVLNEETAGRVISMHNQENRAENELFEKGTGDFLRLFAAVGMKQPPFEVSGHSSLQTYLPHFTNKQTLILVHNTFITEEDIEFAQRHARNNHLKVAFCLCPNANIYIENTLPPVDLLIKHHGCLVLGTDSYGSNTQLNMADEIGTLLRHFPHLSQEMVLRWATQNGAQLLGWKDLGRFQPGNRPGLVVVKNLEPVVSSKPESVRII